MYPLNIDERMYIVDGFYTNPDNIRQYAINAEKEPESGGNYAGVMTENRFITDELVILSKRVHNYQANLDLQKKVILTLKTYILMPVIICGQVYVI